MYDWATISKSFIRIWAFFLSWILPIHFLHWDVDTNHFWSLSRSHWTRVRVVIESLSAVLDQTIIYPAIRAQSLLRASWESLCWPNYRSRVNPAFSSQYSEEKCIILTFFTAKVFNLNQFISNSVTLPESISRQTRSPGQFDHRCFFPRHLVYLTRGAW